MRVLKILLLGLLFSCTEEKGTKDSFSRTIDTLSRFIDLSVYKPVNVIWKVMPRGIQPERMSAPGPTDYLLQAFIQFDRATADRLKSQSKAIDDYDMAIVKYRFSWLPDMIIKEEFKTSKVYEPDAFVKSPYLDGDFIFLSPNTILIQLRTR